MLILSIPQCHRFVEAFLSDPDARRAAEAIGFEEDAENASLTACGISACRMRERDGSSRVRQPWRGKPSE